MPEIAEMKKMTYTAVYYRAKKLAEKGYFEILPPELVMKARLQKQRVEKVKKIIDFLNSKNGVAPIAEVQNTIPGDLHRILIEHIETFQLIKIRWAYDGGKSKGVILSDHHFIKIEYLAKTFLALRKNHTGMVKFFMKIFKERKYDRDDIHALTTWLKRFGLTKAERVAIITHLGYRYSAANFHSSIGHMKINGFFDKRPKVMK